MSTYHAHLFGACGLGNRIKGIASACRLNNNGHVTIWWPPVNWGANPVGCRMHDIFTVDNSEVHDADYRGGQPEYSSWRLWVSRDEVPRGFSEYCFAAELDGQVIEQEYNRIPQPIIDAYAPIFARFHPTDAVMARVNSVPSPEIAVQVRESQEWSRGPNICEYVEYIRKLDTDKPIYVAAIDDHNYDVVANAFPPGKIYTLPGVNRLCPVDAFAEMLILGNAKYLHATELSTYSEAGWWLGGCRGQVSMIRNYWRGR